MARRAGCSKNNNTALHQSQTRDLQSASINDHNVLGFLSKVGGAPLYHPENQMKQSFVKSDDTDTPAPSLCSILNVFLVSTDHPGMASFTIEISPRATVETTGDANRFDRLNELTK